MAFASAVVFNKLLISKKIVDDEKVIKAEEKRLPLFSHFLRFIKSIRHLLKCYKLGFSGAVLL